MKTPRKQTTENYIKEIHRNTRRIFSSEQKIQIVMEALRAKMSVAELCRKYSINESQLARAKMFTTASASVTLVPIKQATPKTTTLKKL
jgi:transposase-like protein